MPYESTARIPWLFASEGIDSSGLNMIDHLTISIRMTKSIQCLQAVERDVSSVLNIGRDFTSSIWIFLKSHPE